MSEEKFIAQPYLLFHISPEERQIYKVLSSIEQPDNMVQPTKPVSLTFKIKKSLPISGQYGKKVNKVREQLKRLRAPLRATEQQFRKDTWEDTSSNNLQSPIQNHKRSAKSESINLEKLQQCSQGRVKEILHLLNENRQFPHIKRLSNVSEKNEKSKWKANEADLKEGQKLKLRLLMGARQRKSRLSVSVLSNRRNEYNDIRDSHNSKTSKRQLKSSIDSQTKSFVMQKLQVTARRKYSQTESPVQFLTQVVQQSDCDKVKDSLQKFKKQNPYLLNNLINVQSKRGRVSFIQKFCHKRMRSE